MRHHHQAQAREQEKTIRLFLLGSLGVLALALIVGCVSSFAEHAGATAGVSAEALESEADSVASTAEQLAVFVAASEPRGDLDAEAVALRSQLVEILSENLWEHEENLRALAAKQRQLSEDAR
jgi:hypothetical protein